MMESAPKKRVQAICINPLFVTFIPQTPFSPGVQVSHTWTKRSFLNYNNGPTFQQNHATLFEFSFCGIG